MKIFSIDRKSPILSTSSLACLRDVASVNLTVGCAHGCAYCYTRGYSSFPGEGKVGLYCDLPGRLKDELRRKRKLPRRVWFSPSSDLFQPVPEIQAVAFECLEILFQAGIEVAFLTKGAIPEPHFTLLERFAPLCRAQIGLITTDETIRQIFEPYASSVAVRLAQIERLQKAKIPVSVRLDPILPEFTDSAETFETLCAVLGRLGICDLAASVLFLRPGFASTLRRHFANLGLPETWHERLESLILRFQNAPRLTIQAASSTTLPLPLSDRLAIFSRLQTAAVKHKMRIHICTCKNPDLPGTFFSVQTLPKCQISGLTEPRPDQLTLWTREDF